MGISRAYLGILRGIGGTLAGLSPGAKRRLTVDLERKTISCGNLSCGFTIDPVRRQRLLNGWDDIALTESFRDQILAFKAEDRSRHAWTIPSE
jgi:3-isopropylmalate/(R)-2-methylmalate dehydratase small subunit